MKIDSCIIVKDEVKNIGKLINQFLLFSNEIHITDTGSTDGTLDVIENIVKNHPNVYLHHFEWVMDFAKARNYSLTCYDCKADYQFWCDADDELNDKLIETLKDFVNSNDKTDDIYFMKYQYYDGDKDPHNRTSLLKVSSKLKWYDPIHEYVQYYTNHKLNYTLFSNGSLIIHKRQMNVVHTDRNLKIFMNMEKTKYKFSARNRFYYGRELMHNKLFDCARYQFYKCIDSEEKNRIDKINASIKLLEMQDDNAVDYFFKLFKEGIVRKDLFYKVATYYFYKYPKDDPKHNLAEMYYIMCINMENPISSLSFGYQSSCHINSLLQLCVIEYNKKNIKKSIEYNKKILEIDPNNKTAKDNIELLTKKLNK